MAGIYDMVDALQEMGAQLRSNAADAEAATTAIRERNKAEAESTTGGMTTGSKGGSMGASSSRDTSGTQNGIQNASPSGSLTITTGDLGDPRNAEEQMARTIASIEAAMRR